MIEEVISDRCPARQLRESDSDEVDALASLHDV